MRILHVFRVPVGGLFRHVCDLSRGQAEHGHDVSIVCDSAQSGEAAEAKLADTVRFCSLGIARFPISRLPGIGDLSAVSHVMRHADKIKPDIIHCHGAKGGLHGRIAGWRLAIPTVYTPHGGSLHYRWASPAGAAFLAAEFALAHISSGLHFVCNHERDMFRRKIGMGRAATAVIHNGLWPDEFETVPADSDADDIVFIGEMRKLKGVDVLIAAMARLVSTRPIRACLVGDGPDLAAFKRQVSEAALDGLITFPGRLAARQAFRRGRLLVVPSRAESFPYVVLEAMAAGKPTIAARVGGIPEALDEHYLFPPDNVDALAAAIERTLAQGPQMEVRALRLRDVIKRRFTVEAMVSGILGFYASLLAK